MNENMETLFGDYLSDLYPDWLAELPTLLDYFIHIELDTGEHLPAKLGDIYFVGVGTIGKYEKHIPKRYILKTGIIIVPLKRNNVQLKAIEASAVLLLKRDALYSLLKLSPDLIKLYDELLAQQQQEKDFRTHLLEISKGDRLTLFREKFSQVIPLITRRELAKFLDTSEEFLRQRF
ncbi:hypothetical protein [Sphingobacterium pedocola]|uniref:Crp/Fnr family transcriptional regulator n=1 Tax=Sphingobacterium pedocola TaxID=2082722 RepID=A0ABR9T551_9SPHI|nr:hypothetical protein [Sphingobacterium pedocola]MBE8719782.1 hypothetical protein [Sphingobacterium pedocola]